ncbi:SAM-dependent DNA methyltransferase (plasmid) [Rhodococcoides fascians A21d2]|uniref:Eco57I restriction-modification methylase domain-containing protein n=1 Tax=Rhodococcoides fascians TaxID=1828 RepID=UPI00056D0EA5|nr:N-6 DNA methylase [Rhodococcus fascians]QII03813.1 SAM-dependent DNA methyltransferase [Rhodococcus fascians A21d2]
MSKAIVTRLLSNDPKRTEADVQSDIKELLLTPVFDLNDQQRPKLEVQTADNTGRRIDILAGSTVIEVKKDLNPAVRRAAEPQLSGYIESRLDVTGGRYNGILTDGRRWILFERDPATTVLMERSDLTIENVDDDERLMSWLGAVLATDNGLTPTPQGIEDRLGASSPAYAQDHAYLASLYGALADDTTVALKRQLWARLLRSALGTGFDSTQGSLFIDHTMLVIEATVISHALMGFSEQEMMADPAATLAGEKFAEHDIFNAVEPGFFDWLLAHEDGQKYIRQLIRRVSVFDWDRAEHDVLKHLYESVVNAATRKTLGEYYTPDWLAQAVLEQTVGDDILGRRVLDAACGSGTFIFHAVRRYLAAADAAGLGPEAAIDGALSHVFGLDIHPVSVVLARTTYLMALGTRLSGKRGAITVPIYLGDAVQWAADASVAADTIKIPVEANDLADSAAAPTLIDIVQTLVFPIASIDDPATFDRLTNQLTERAQQVTSPKTRRPPLAPILAAYSIPQNSEDGKILKETYNLLCDLNAQGRNHIWGFFVRNQVRPLWFSLPGRKVDVLIGNPPWVSYRFMTGAMQEKFQTFCKNRNLWHGRSVATHQDLVALFIVRACELYLKDGGQFGFVTPLAVLDRKHYEGFRAGNWGAFERGEITQWWDLEHVRPQPFPVPAGALFGVHHNYDAVPIGSGGEPPHGSPDTKQAFSGRSAETWEASDPQLIRTTVPYTARKTSDLSASPYGDLARQGAIIVPRYLFFVERTTATGRLGHAAGKQPVTSRRSSLEKAPWKDRPALQGSVEKPFLHSTLLGESVAPFRLLKSYETVLPVIDGRIVDHETISRKAGFAQWWKTANAEWDDHKTGRAKSAGLTLTGQLDHMAKLSGQLQGAKHRVLYSKSGNTLAAARTTNTDHIIDHALYLVPARNESEAIYLTSVLNAPAITRAVEQYQSRGLFGARHFDKYVWMLPIPRFDSDNPAHQQIVDYGRYAEQISAAVHVPDGTGFQRARKLVREALEAEGVHAALDAAITPWLPLVQ